MICPICSADNRSGRKFCVSCGSALAATCPNCGLATEAGERFCGECGFALSAGAVSSGSGSIAAAAAAAAEGHGHAVVAERRLVSVLFADLVGFTALSDQRDPEETRELLSRWFDLAREVIGRYGGSVEKFIGDAVMAVWGAPTAREDDAERSVRAALDIVGSVPRLGSGITARAGVLTGEAAVTLGAVGQGMVAGDLVNTASRLQSAAAPGTVLVGEATERIANRAIAFERVTDQTLKGKALPVPAWRALRVVAEVGGKNRGSTGPEAPFVGRADELRLLRELFHATNRERRSRLISVIGPGGIGKTRIAWEFLKYVDGLVEGVWWHDGRSPAYGDGITFWALGEMVRARAGLLETDDEATTRAKVREAVEQHMPDEVERQRVEPALLALLGVQSDVGSAELFAAWRTFFERLSETSPVVMVFEDFHYADPGLIDFVDYLMEWSRSYPITVITLSRPELLDKRADWGAGKRSFTSVYLDPLSADHMRELLAGLVPGLPESAIRSIVARADGVPLYAVETVRMLVADGRLELVDGAYRPVGSLGTLTVPETLTALIASRLDALSLQDRGIVADAAVLGQSFTPHALSAVSGQNQEDVEASLRTLVRREIVAVESDPRSPERGQYAFVQGLIREVAYNTLSFKDRKTRHLAAARFFESLGNEELVGALAGHYLAAYRSSPEGPEASAAAAQARVSLKAAAERAVNLGSNVQAMNFLRQAVEVATDPTERADLLERAAEAASFAARYEEGEALARQAIDVRTQLGVRDGIVRATMVLVRGLMNSSRTREALASIEQLLGDDVAVSTPDEIALSGQLARGYYLTERPRDAIAVAELVLGAAEHAGLNNVVADTLITKGGALAYEGRLMEALALVRAGTELAEAHGTPTALRGYINQVGAYMALDLRAGFESQTAGLALARRRGVFTAEGSLLSNAAEFAVRLGEWDWAVEQLSGRLADDLGVKDAADLSQWAVVLAAYRGEPTEPGRDAIRRGMDLGLDLQVDAELADVDGAIAFAQGRYADAVGHWLKETEIKPSQKIETLPLAIRAAAWAGDKEQHQQLLERYLTLGLHGPVIDLDEATMKAQALGLAGHRDEALPLFVHAVRLAERMGARWDQALIILDAVLLVGAEPAVPADLIPTARRIFTELRARPFLALLDSLVAAASEPTAAAALSARAASEGASVSVPS